MKNTILNTLKSSSDYISGEEISRRIGISRAAVWKHIKKLRAEGYDIESVTNKGYKLINDGILSEDAAKALLTTEFIGRALHIMNVCDSTNEEAKRHFADADGSLFVSEVQTGGKGRLGRSWASERSIGIWMTLLLKPELPPQDVPQITLIAGIAVCRALGGSAMIKWPNDVVIGSKKVCGILTEMSAEMDRVNYVVCGIGINVNTKHFDDELAEKATSLYIETGTTYQREPIIAAVMNEFEPLYKEFLKNGFSGVYEEYKSVCTTLGKTVRVISRGTELIGTAIDISPEGGLIVDTGKEHITITSGEVSVRGMYGYI